MVDPISLSLGLGAARTGLQMFGLDPASRAAAKQQGVFENNLSERRRIFDELDIDELLRQTIESPRKAIRAARGRFESGIASFAQEEQRRIQRALVRGGATGASDTAANQRRKLGGDILQRQIAGEAQLENFAQRSRGQSFNTVNAITNAQYGTAAQNIQGQAAGAGNFVDPLQSLSNLAITAALAGQFGGGGGGGFTNLNEGDFTNLQNASSFPIG